MKTSQRLSVADSCCKLPKVGEFGNRLLRRLIVRLPNEQSKRGAELDIERRNVRSLDSASQCLDGLDSIAQIRKRHAARDLQFHVRRDIKIQAIGI